jgi:hypothetical protein
VCVHLRDRRCTKEPSFPALRPIHCVRRASTEVRIAWCV